MDAFLSSLVHKVFTQTNSETERPIQKLKESPPIWAGMGYMLFPFVSKVFVSKVFVFPRLNLVQMGIQLVLVGKGEVHSKVGPFYPKFWIVEQKSPS